MRNKKRSILKSVPFCWNISTILSIQISDRILEKTVWLVSETHIRNEYEEQEKKHLKVCSFLLKYFNNFEHPDIWSNLGENCLISFRDSHKKRIWGIRNNKKHLKVSPFLLKYLNNFEHPDIWSNLEENCLISFRDSNKKWINGTRNNKKRLMIYPFLFKDFNNFENQHI